MSSTTSGSFHVSKSILQGAVGIGLYLAWWNIYHEEGFLHISLLPIQMISCVASYLGIVLAGLVGLVMSRGRRLSGLLCFFDWKILLIQLFSGLLLELGTFLPNITLSVLGQVLVGASAFYVLIIVASKLFILKPRDLALLIALSVFVYGCAELLMFGVDSMFRSASLRIVLHTGFLFAAWLAILFLWRSPQASKEPEKKKRKSRAPMPLCVHIVSYALVFGMTHALASGVVVNPLEKMPPSYLGVILGGFVFLILFVREGNATMIWPKIRAAVFPLTMLSFILLPLALHEAAFVSVLIAECASISYFALFFYACSVIAYKTQNSPQRIVSYGLAIAAAAFAFGVVAADLLKIVFELSTTTYSILSAFAFIVLAGGTFWVGDDKKASLVWGMVEKLPPKKFNDLTIAKKCDALSSEHHLTAREKEVLLLLAQGKNVATIAKVYVVSLNTVRTHVSRIHRKLNVHSQQELIDLVAAIELP